MSGAPDLAYYAQHQGTGRYAATAALIDAAMEHAVTCDDCRARIKLTPEQWDELCESDDDLPPGWARVGCEFGFTVRKVCPQCAARRARMED